MSDFDSVCDLQARSVKNSEVSGRRRTVGSSKKEVANVEGSKPSDDGGVGGIAGTDPPTKPREASTTTPVVSAPAAKTSGRKGKKKVGVSGSGTDVPIFDAGAPEVPPDPMSDLNPRSGRGKRPADGTPNSAVRPPKRASRVVQYVISSDEKGADDLAPTGSTAVGDVTPKVDAERATTAVSPPRVVTTDPSAPISSPKSTSPLLASGDPNLPFAGQPGLADVSGPSGQPRASTSGFSFTDEVPPFGPTEAGEGSDQASLSGFSATDICSHLVTNDVYIGEGL